MDALAEVVHVLEVLAPASVDDLEDDEALDITRDLWGPELLLLGVELEGLVPKVLQQRLAAHLGQVLPQLLDSEVGVREAVERLYEPVEIPKLDLLALGVQGDEALQHLVDPLLDLIGEIGALEHLPALGVDHLALGVQDVVVLEDVLTGDEVLLLDLLLRVLDLLREEARLHR